MTWVAPAAGETAQEFGRTFARAGVACLSPAHRRSRLPVIILQKRIDPLLGAAGILVDRQGHIDRRDESDRHRARLRGGSAAPRPIACFQRARSASLANQPSKCRAGPLEGGAHRTGHPDRRAAGTVGGRAQHAALHRPAALPVDRLSGPQGAGQPQAFHHAADAAFERHARRGEFRPDIGHVAGDARPEDKPSLADLIERGELMRQHDRVAQCRQKDRGAERHLSGARRHRGQQGQRIVARPRQQRIPDPHRIEAQSLGARRELQQRRGLRAGLP